MTDSGAFSAFLFYKVGALCAIASLFIIYQLSQYYKHEGPFPSQDITHTARHYPEFLVFRLSTITGSTFIVLGWLTNYFVLRTLAVQASIDLKALHGKTPLYLGVTAGLLLMGNTGTIDTGVMNWTWHGICASTFFILTFAAQIYNTLICRKMKQAGARLSNINMKVKYFILVLLLIQLVYSVLPGTDGLENEELNSKKSNFTEWTLTATVISMFLSIGMDANQFEFVYTPAQQTTLNCLPRQTLDNL